jgi:hypothetical protein
MHTCTNIHMHTYPHMSPHIHTYTYIDLKRIDMIVIPVRTWIA